MTIIFTHNFLNNITHYCYLFNILFIKKIITDFQLISPLYLHINESAINCIVYFIFIYYNIENNTNNLMQIEEIFPKNNYTIGKHKHTDGEYYHFV